MEPTHEKTYRSPQRKLVKFFERSRDQWKAKQEQTVRELEEVKKSIRCWGQTAKRRGAGGEVVRHHQYGVQQVLVVVSLVLSSATSLRGAGWAVAVLQECAGVVPWKWFTPPTENGWWAVAK